MAPSQVGTGSSALSELRAAGSWSACGDKCQCKAHAVQVHDQRSIMTEEEEGAGSVWLDGQVASTQEDSGLQSQARHMIQGQRQYYDEVHVIKEQVGRTAVSGGQSN